MEWLVLDEADKLFEEGKDGFREQVSFLPVSDLLTQSSIFLLLVLFFLFYQKTLEKISLCA